MRRALIFFAKVPYRPSAPAVHARGAGSYFLPMAFHFILIVSGHDLGLNRDNLI